jgi:hypothetical protein
MIAKPMLTTAFLLLATSAAMAQGCQIQRFSFTFGSDTSTTMTVKQGSVCVSNINPHPGSRFMGMRVVQRPRHGMAGNSGTTGVAYKPRPGFVGNDTFVTRVTGAGPNGTVGTSHVTYHVVVTP